MSGNNPLSLKVIGVQVEKENPQMGKENPYSPPSTIGSMVNRPVDNTLKGLGGWLVLVGLGLVVSPFRIAIQVLPMYVKIFSDGTWEALTSPGGVAYNPVWMPFLLSELIVNLCMILGWLYIAFLFFKKKKQFPRFFIVLAIFTIIVQLADTFVTSILVPGQAMFDPETVKELVRSVVFAAIWVPYMLMSKRVKVTFVE